MASESKTENLFANDWAGFHDAIVEALEVQPSIEQAMQIFKSLPVNIQEKAFKFGLNDTEVRDECFEAIQDLNYNFSVGI